MILRKLARFLLALVLLPIFSWDPVSAQAAKKGARPYQAALLMEADTGTILFERDIHKKWPPASMVKMMLMLVVLEGVKQGKLSLSDKVTVSRWASRMGGSQVYLKEGEEFTLEELMKATVIASANDAAVAIAEHVAGDVEGFVDLMNARAKELNLADTYYVSVHGLPPPRGQLRDVTSAYDLAMLARPLLKFGDTKRWGSTWRDTFRQGKFQLTNTNRLVRTFRGTDGIKTGYFSQAGFSITASALRGKMHLIAVVLGAASSKARFAQASRLLSRGFSNYKKVVAVPKGAPVGKPVPVKRGKVREAQLIAARDLVVVVKRGEERQLTVSLESSGLSAPVKKGQPGGQILVMVGDKMVGRDSAVVIEDIEEAGFLQRLFRF
ncbi:MAG: D-alanyl-D-alanine carboxypeptidase family protein [Thermodesulfobacteriota bacterium]